MKKIFSGIGILAALAIVAAPVFYAQASGETLTLTNTGISDGGGNSFYNVSSNAADPATWNYYDFIVGTPGADINFGASNGGLSLVNALVPDNLANPPDVVVQALITQSDAGSYFDLSTGSLDDLEGAIIANGGTYVLSNALTIERSQINTTTTLMGIEVATGTASQFLASANTTISNAGVLEIVAVAVGIPLAFYVLHLLIGLLPKARARRQ